jgi:hypothetical protein
VITTSNILTTAVVSAKIIPILLLNDIRLKIDYTPAVADPSLYAYGISYFTPVPGNSTMF